MVRSHHAHEKAAETKQHKKHTTHAAHASSKAIAQMVLPETAIGKMDIGRLVREADALENFLRESEIRKPGTSVKMPKTSRLMDEFITVNKLNPLHKQDRKVVLDYLDDIYHKAPVMHMSFAADPSPQFTKKLVARLRQQIHPQLLIQIGLQPDIGAGCLVRTNSKYFDLSLSHRFASRREALADVLRNAANFDAAATKTSLEQSPAQEPTT